MPPLPDLKKQKTVRVCVCNLMSHLSTVAETIGPQKSTFLPKVIEEYSWAHEEIVSYMLLNSCQENISENAMCNFQACAFRRVGVLSP